MDTEAPARMLANGAPDNFLALDFSHQHPQLSPPFIHPDLGTHLKHQGFQGRTVAPDFQDFVQLPLGLLSSWQGIIDTVCFYLVPVLCLLTIFRSLPRRPLH